MVYGRLCTPISVTSVSSSLPNSCKKSEYAGVPGVVGCSIPPPAAIILAARSGELSILTASSKASSASSKTDCSESTERREVFPSERGGVWTLGETRTAEEEDPLDVSRESRPGFVGRERDGVAKCRIAGCCCCCCCCT